MSSRMVNESTKPLVSIGLPVYNEAHYLDETLKSVTAQSYENIEIIISDNASTDRTEEICKEYANRFPRIRYYRADTNRGLAKNYAAVLQKAKGKYFVWGSGHDLWSTNFVSACLSSLQANPGAVLAVPASNWIDQNGMIIEKKSGFSDTRGMDILARYFTIFWGNMHPAYGLTFTELLKSKPLLEIVGEDLIILTFLGLRGDFIHTSDALWSRREFRFEKSYTERMNRYKRGSQLVAKTKFDKMFPYVKLVTHLFITIFQAKIPIMTKCLIIFLLCPSVFVKYFSGSSIYKVD